MRVEKMLADLDHSGWITEQVQVIRDELSNCDMGAAIVQIDVFDSGMDLHKWRLAELRAVLVESCEAAVSAKAGAQ